MLNNGKWNKKVDNKDLKYIKLENRIEELECKVAFQENSLDELNKVLANQQASLNKMMVQIRYLADKTKQFNESIMAPDEEETPPPHY